MKTASLSFSFAVVLGLAPLPLQAFAQPGQGQGECSIQAIEAAEGKPAFFSVTAKGRVVHWLKYAEAGSFKNEGSVDPQGAVTDSEAFKACANKKDENGNSLGLTLPSREDYEALFSCFELSTRVQNSFSEGATKEFYALFPENHDQVFFWTSSPSSKRDHQEGTQVFLSPPAFSFMDWSRSFNESVRCVRQGAITP